MGLFFLFHKSVREMQPAIILLVLINDCKVFAYLQSPFLPHDPEHLCKTEKKKSNSFPPVVSQGEMFFLLPPVSSKFCSFITSDVRLKARGCFFPPLFCHPQLQRAWISDKTQKSRGHVN